MTYVWSQHSFRLAWMYSGSPYVDFCNYPVELINDGINRAMDIPLAQLRTTRLKEEKQDEKIPFITTHIPCNHNIFKSAKRFFPILE